LPNEYQTTCITPEIKALWWKLNRIFTPEAARQIEELYGKGVENSQARFVHYTSAETALKIIKSKRIWMRNVTCMADFAEVRHGFDIVKSVLNKPSMRSGFIEALNACAPGTAQATLERFERSGDELRFNTYIASISRHKDAEDRDGRLSMWRAYGGNSGRRVAIVLKIPGFTPASLALQLRFSPVAYFTEEQACKTFSEVIEGIRDNCEFLSAPPQRQIVPELMYQTLISAAVCLKHPGFQEELEWRAIHFPKSQPSHFMKPSIEAIGGIPQVVYPIPLDEKCSEGAEAIRDLDISRVFDRLIIGPTQYPWAIAEAFTNALRDAGVPNATVSASRIPIRF
jgi:hypothetical protein